MRQPFFALWTKPGRPGGFWQDETRINGLRLIPRLELLICCVAVTVVGTVALASSTIINFDDLPAGTFVGTQYHNSGLDLNSALLGFAPVILADAAASSPPNVLDISDPGSSSEFPRSYVEGTFANPHHSSVKVFVGNRFGTSGGNATLTAYDLSGTVVASQTAVLANGGQLGAFQVLSSSSNIARFTVTSTDRRIVIDDLSFDALGGSPLPDFGLGVTSVELLPGGNGSTTVTVHRFNGSFGDVTLSVSNLPPGVSVSSIVPNPSSGPDGATALLTLTANASVTPVQNWPLKLTGSPTSTNAGQYGPHSVTLLLTVLDVYDAQVLGIEVTQGIQVYDLPTGAPVGVALHGVPVPYAGVPLAALGQTVVRVFANFHIPPLSSSPPSFSVALYGFRNGMPLGEVLPYFDKGEMALFFGGNYVSDADRAGQFGKEVDFVLPNFWTTGSLTLKAVLSAAPQFGPPVSMDCCPDNDSFTLTDIPFTPTPGVDIAPFALTVNGGPLTSPSSVFEEARNLLPIGAGQFHLGNYVGSIDVTDIWNKTVKVCLFGICIPEGAKDRATEVGARLRDVADDNNYSSSPNLLIAGVYPQSVPSGGSNRIGGMEIPCHSALFEDCDGLNGVAVVQDRLRPRTSVAHELGHLFGRDHAGEGPCPNNTIVEDPKEPWPPDNLGYIQGVGVDRRTFKVLFPDRTGGSLGAPIFDFMSYCANTNDSDSWISVRGWSETVAGIFARALLFGAAGVVPTAGQSSVASLAQQSATRNNPVLLVQAFVDASGDAYITKVAPSRRPVATPPPNSVYDVIALSRAGKILSRTNMRISEAHIDDAANVTFLGAEVPLVNDDVAALEIRKGGVPIGRKVRSKHAPTVKAVQVLPRNDDDDSRHDEKRSEDDQDDRPGPKDGGDNKHGEAHDADDVAAAQPGTTIVKWIARDEDGDSLMAKVDYSTDNGRSWHVIFMGPNHNQAALRSALFTTSKQARVRVRVNDGFDEGSAVSQLFVATGAPPVVDITSPAPGLVVKTGASLYLSGEASDESRTAIVGSGLSWYTGTTLLGTGESISVSGFPLGQSEIRLMATDSRGRTTSNSVIIITVP